MSNNPVTMPMSFASIAYAFFAFQQNVQTADLEPIQFRVDAMPVLLTGEIGYDPMSTARANTFLQQQGGEIGLAGAPAAGMSLAEAEAFSSTAMFVDGIPQSSPVDPALLAAAVDDSAGTAGHTGFSNTGMFVPGAPPSSPPAFIADDELPPIVAPVVEEEADEDEGGNSPRASVQIGLLKELSFLDD